MSRNLDLTVNLKDFKRIEEALEKMSKQEADKFIESSTKKIAVELLSKTIDSTPRDTSNLARHWTNHADPEKYVDSAPSAEDYVDAKDVEKSGKRYTFTIYNNASYAYCVENGHRTRDHKGWVDGALMLKNNLNKMDKKMGKKLDKYLTQFLQENLS